MTGFDKRIQVSFNLFVLYKIFYSSLFGVQIGLISSKSHINTCCLSQNYGTPPSGGGGGDTHTHTHNNNIQFPILLWGTQSHKGF